MLWFIFGTMLLSAALVVAVPLFKQQGRFSLVSATIVVGVIALSAGLYSRIGTPDADSADPGRSGGNAADPGVASVEDMVQALFEKLQENPDDPEGWKMLGRSYMQIGDAVNAIVSFEKAAALEGGTNGETLISLGEALMTSDQTLISGRAGVLFETGLALEPNNPRGLFFAGLAAASRGDIDIAADRWELLLTLSPPPEIEQLLRDRVAEWRGEPVADVQKAPESIVAPSIVVTIEVSVADAAAAAINPDSSVFIIARDPAQPSPPLAVARRKAGELPSSVFMSDVDSMVPGRILSAYDNLEIIVRVSASGQPMAQTGDWYGQSTVRPADNSVVEVVVDRQVP
jgi:cytochrome c-type biogenesis protein CcmH